ncbi:hypothetical protein H6P81_006340 [Aristolochia fimbriata]|uniref:Retrovirus-related Pol polyprotein from transposon TNT 1-94-like beta-barrel domain-containing protein n=1 Tax=Aristolochia fimbriata TaxID=158543 RepID=A0AAV7F0R1_ARIFI|nr:hypothetical protein H6P81_006340 [Aristolochia fimbriata]
MGSYLMEGASNTRPPLLDGSNYSYLKAKMQIYIKALDEKAWKTIEKGWCPPTKKIGEGANMKTVEKPHTEWTEEEERFSNCNSKALNAIFGGMLTTQFELMWMRDDESILEYEGKIRDIANQSAALGDKIPQNRLVRKVLRSLSSKFKIKRVAIEEYKVIDYMTLDELIGSLKTFEMNEEAEDSAENGKKESLALQSVSKGEAIQLADNCDVSISTLAELDEKVSLLAKGINKFIIKNRQNNARTGSTEVLAKKKVVSECPTYLRKQKSFSDGWSDDESSESDEDECNFVTFAAKLRQKLGSSSKSKNSLGATNSKEDTNDEDEEIIVEAIIQQWDGVLESTRILKEHLCVLEQENAGLKKQIDEMRKENQKPKDERKTLREKVLSLEKDNHNLQQEVAEKEKVILKLEEDLRRSQDILKKFDKGKQKLDDILIQGRRSCQKQGLGYSKIVYNKFRSRQNKSSRGLVCHYCGVYGHIRPHCYKLLKYWRWSGARMVSKPASKYVWIKKEISLYAAHTTRKTTSDRIWYFDSGCSRHMTGNAKNLTNIHRDDGGQVTFGDGAKGAVIGRGVLKVDGLPKLKNVLLVNGLKANLLSISQLCDHNMHVRFTKEGCIVEDDEKQSTLEGTRTGDNCYKLNVSLHSIVYISGYSRNSHAYRVFLKNANIVIETVNVEVADQTESLQMSDDEQEHVPLIQKEGTISIVTHTPECAPKDTGVSSTEIQESGTTKEKAPSIRM